MLEEINRANEKVASSDEPYWAGTELHGLANSLMTEFGVAYRLFWIWSELTDRYELKPGERPKTVAAMRRAAEEWLLVAADSTSRDAYLERWLFQELALSRKIGEEF